MNLKVLAATAALLLASLPDTASAGGIDIRIGVGNPGLGYVTRAPAHYYDRRPDDFQDRRPAYPYYNNSNGYRDWRGDRYWRNVARWRGYDDRTRHRYCEDD